MKKKKGSGGTTGKNFPKNKYYLVLGIAVLIVLLLLILLVKALFDNLKPSYYSVENRQNNIEERQEKAKDNSGNYDVVGWVRVQGTKIDFPVVSGKNETFNSPVETTGYGWLSNLGDTEYHNVLRIYGHNVMNLGYQPYLHDESFVRFEELLAFTDYDFAKDNLYFQYSMNGEDYLYKIFAVSILSPYELDALPDGDFTKDELDDYVKTLKNNSIYDYSVDVSAKDDIVSLITCTGLLSDGYSYNDMIITGKRVAAGESAKKYSVNKSANYAKIEKIMKGDVDNEE